MPSLEFSTITKWNELKERYFEVAGHSLRSSDGNILPQGPGGGGDGEGPGRATENSLKLYKSNRNKKYKGWKITNKKWIKK